MNLHRRQNSPSWLYLLQESALILAFSYLVMIASNQNGLIDPTLLGATAGLLSLLAIVFAWKGQVAPGRALPVGLFLGALLLSGLTSIDPRRSLAEVWLIAIPFFLFFFIAWLVRRGWPGELVIKSLLAVGAILMAFSWLEALGWYVAWLRAAPGQWLPSIPYRLPAPNFLAVMFNILLLTASARLPAAGSRLKQALLGLYALSALGLLYLTSSRGGWIGAIAGLAVLALLAPAPEQRQALFARLRASRALQAAALLGGALALAAFGWLLYRQSAQPTHGALLSSRQYLWAPAWQAFRSSPLLGSGPHTYAGFFLRQNSVPPGELFVYAHNIYLDVLGGSGLLGLAAFGGLVFALVRGLLRRFKLAQGNRRPPALAALAALAAFGVHGLFDSVHHTMPTALWTLAIVLAAALGEGSAARRPSRAADWSVKALGVALAALTWLNVWATLPLYGGVQAANAGDWGAAVAQLEPAARRDPRMAITQQQLGLGYAVLAEQGQAGALERAVAAFERSTRLDPYWAADQANLAALYRQSGNLPAAQAAFERAVRLAPDWALYRLRLAEVLEVEGNLSAAQAEYTHALELQPGWAEADFWQGSPLRSETLVAWMQDQPAALEEPPGLAQMEAGLAADPARLTPYLPLGRAYLEAGRLDEAGALLGRAQLATAGRDASRLELAWLQAELAARRGDYRQAARLGERVLFGYENWGVMGPGWFGVTLYGEHAFRRAAMSLEVVPQLGAMQPAGLESRRAQVTAWRQQGGELDP